MSHYHGHIVVVDDDPVNRLKLSRVLTQQEHTVSVAENGRQVIEMLAEQAFDLMLLDIVMPEMDGIETLKRIKAHDKNLDVIMISAVDRAQEATDSLKLGAYDYITKPFRVRELLSRVKALIRRNARNVITGNILISGNLVVDTYAATIKKENMDISLTAQEYKLLLMFINNSFVLIKRDDILKSLTQEEYAYFDENTLSVYIKRIREKIEDDPKNPQYIITKRGLGYKWDKEVSKG